MSPSGSVKLVKAGFVQIDTATGVTTRTLPFQYNPETLTRHLEVIDPAGEPREIVTFTVNFDIPDNGAQSQELGILPALSALELLLYPSANSLLVWISGRRIVPVRVNDMQVMERSFDPRLNPTRAQVALTLHLLKDSDLANNPRGKALWNEYFKQLQQLAEVFASNLPAGTFGIGGS